MKETFPGSEPTKATYYELLGISRSATPEEIRAAFRKLAMQWHPDRNPNNPEAEERFKEISEANNILSDENKRKLYDRALSTETPGYSSFQRSPGPKENTSRENIYDGSQPGSGSSTGNTADGSTFETMRRHREEAWSARNARRGASRTKDIPSSADMEEAYHMNLSQNEAANEDIERYKTENPILYRELLHFQEMQRSGTWDEWSRQYGRSPTRNPADSSGESNAKRLEEQKTLERLRREILSDE
jgi:curved DNA-binding protein CbpA